MFQSSAVSRTPKVLLVDDSATTHMWIKMVLGKAQYELVSAKDGVEGVAMAVEHHPDLILMDVVMPKMNGFEATTEIRRHPDLAHTPVIMVTTRSEAKNVEAGFAAGCSDYITKPIDATELLAKVRAALSVAPRLAVAG